MESVTDVIKAFLLMFAVFLGISLMVWAIEAPHWVAWLIYLYLSFKMISGESNV